MLLPIPDVLTPAQLSQLSERLTRPTGPMAASPPAISPRRPRTTRSCPKTARSRARPVRWCSTRCRAAVRFSAALPRRIYPPLFNRYSGGQSFGYHVDNAVRYDRSRGGADPVRTDVSATLFLSDPDSYDGGELVIEDTYGTQSVKLPAGHLVIYPGTSLHKVMPVTRGTRVASFFWIQSMLRNDAQRRLLFELDVSIRRLTQDTPGHPSLIQLTGVYHNLLRQWADV